MKESFPLNNGSQPSESSFHQARFERSAEEANESLLIRYGLKEGVTAYDKAYEEALRDNADFDRRRSKEFELWQKNLSVVIDRLKEKIHSPEAHLDTKACLLVLGGGMKAARSVGQAMALYEIGLGQAFDSVIGVSAGSGVAVGFVEGRSGLDKIASMYFEECGTKEFINYKRIHKVLDPSIIAKTMRTGPKAIDTVAINKSDTKLYVAATNAFTGEIELIDTKTASPDMVAACEASAAIPLFQDPVLVNGNSYIDGALNQFPLEEVIEKFSPTDILVLPSTSFSFSNNLEYNDSEHAILWGLSMMGSLGSNGSASAEDIIRSKERLRIFLDQISQINHVNIGVLWPPEVEVSNFTTNPDTLKAAVLECAQETMKEFDVSYNEAAFRNIYS
jgi:predicted patatin/cPLA2 family phospholipase